MKKQLLYSIFSLLFTSIIPIFAQETLTCNNLFTDQAGPNANYANSSDYTVTIVPANPGEQVTVTFLSFDTEVGWDGLYVFDGSTIESPQIASSNNAGNVPGGLAGAFWGTTIPGPFTSTNAEGTLTFRFRSDISINRAGWIATISCGTTSTCIKPTSLISSAITTNSVVLGWVDNTNNTANSWEVIALPCGTTPTENTTGTITTINPYEITGLDPETCYNLFVRAICSSTDSSIWSNATTITTLPAPIPQPVCGGQFFDNGGISANYLNASNAIYTICPTNSGELVTVTFTAFDTESNWDGMYVFDGNSIASSQIASSNTAGNVPGGLAGSFWGTTIPGPFTSSSPDGCLTFQFRSDGSVNRAGWIANVTCETAPTCPKPTALAITSNTETSAVVSWNETGTATEWEIIYLLTGSPAPTATDTGVIVNSNPHMLDGLTYGITYDFYVRSRCASDDISNWSSAKTFTLSCAAPTNLSVSNVNTNGASIYWTNQTEITEWEVIVLPTGSPAPDANSTGIVTNTNSYTITGLTTGVTYDVYVQSNCSSSLNSEWSIATTFTTTVVLAPLVTNSTQFTPEQLVGNILVNNPCITISNVTSSTGTNFGSTNGIGYFTNTNPTFPIDSGIVLSTGNIDNIPGPNTSTLSDGNATTWLGDADLETIINNATGTIMNSKNATKLEFDFTSLNEFMSFNFLFASDEYGTFQCTYSDAFAFLLTDLETGITTNLAVVPGTTTPISVVTIRDVLYNTGCSSVNPDFFDTYYTGGNVYSSATNFNGQTVEMSASSAILPNHPYHIKLVVADRSDSLFDSAVFIKAGSFTSGPPQCSDKIELIAYIDANNNGVKDTNETNFTYGSFVYQQNNVGDVTNISSPFGSYTVYDSNSSNTYDFSYLINSEYSTYFSIGAISYNDINIALGSGTQTLYFPITISQGFNDVTVSIAAIGQPRPGFNYTNKVIYKNLGMTSTSGTLTFNKPAETTITNVSQTGTVATTAGFTYDFTNLAPYETRTFNVSMSVPNVPIVNLGDVLNATASISAPSNDINLSNNSFSNSQVVVASYDPNNKTESHGGKIQFNQFTQNDYLYYTINFQNLGTANAINVSINDLLDLRLDEESIRMIDASHNYIMERVNNQITWKFNFINLVPMIANEALSKGFVTFKIKLKPGFAVGDIIPNTAEIYFDNNPAIVTNTFNTEFVTTLSNAVFETGSFLLYPNPATNFVQINLQNATENIKTIVLFDVLGKTIKTIKEVNSNLANINVSELSKGVYFIEVTNDSDLKQVKKLVVK